MDRGNVQTQGGRVNVSKQKRKTAHGIRRPHAPALILLHQLESSIDDTRTSRLGKLVEELDVLRREPLVLAVALEHVDPIGRRLPSEVVRTALDDLAPGKPKNTDTAKRSALPYSSILQNTRIRWGEEDGKRDCSVNFVPMKKGFHLLRAKTK